MNNLHPREEIAIIGIGCRLPGNIKSPSQFWEFLCNGGDGICQIPDDRWDSDALFSSDISCKGKTYVRRGGFLKNIDHFDHEYFGISAREADEIDPQQRLLLETAHEAMEDAGERWDDPGIRNTGVFVGVFTHDYQHMQMADRATITSHSGTGTAMSIAANRVSYVFDLHGPSIAVDTACSSSLVAIDIACKALIGGECDFALAGGVNVILKPEMTIAMSRASMLSKDGRCKSFDASANGYVRGEGAGFVLLRRKSSAQKAGNNIYAVIRGTGVNSDGKTNGISVPNAEAQEQLIRRVLNESHIHPSTIQYVEAHGTGTPVGDPIEAAALGKVFSDRKTERDVCLIGSVKTNIGHLESAAGIAGLIKVALSLKHGVIPKNLHFKTPNPAIDFEGLRLKVVNKRQNWPQTDGPKRAGINSFGFGGTNAHAILEEAPANSCSIQRDNTLPEYIVLPFGAHSPDALKDLAKNYATHVADAENDLQDFLFTASHLRTHGAHRAAILASDREDLTLKLNKIENGETSTDIIIGKCPEHFKGLVFVYSGMGPQWWGMARELITCEPIFRKIIERVDSQLNGLTGWSLLEEMLADESNSRIHKTSIAQPAIFAIQAALTELWRYYGIVPSAVVGHSVGEVAAMYAAGVLTLEDASLVVHHRSRLQETTVGTGSMMAVAIDSLAAAKLIEGKEALVSVSAINGPSSLTLSGDTKLLSDLKKKLDEDGIFARALRVEVPYHSPRMDPIKDDLLASLANITPCEQTIPYYSSADGKNLKSTLGDAQYWWRNVRQPVLFADAILNLIDDEFSCFVELGPHPVLKQYIVECMGLRRKSGQVTHSLHRNQADRRTMTEALATLHVAGAKVLWNHIYPNSARVELPTYPWQRTSHWAESREADDYRRGLTIRAPIVPTGKLRHPLLGTRIDLPSNTWISSVRMTEHTYLKDHKVQEATVFPGAGYLEMALQTTLESNEEIQGAATENWCYTLSNIEIERALYLDDDEEVRLQTTSNDGQWKIYAMSGGGQQSWVKHASGQVRKEKRRNDRTFTDYDAVSKRCRQTLDVDYAYQLFKDVGLVYGPSFQGIRELRYGIGEALARVEVPDALGIESNSWPGPYFCHPAFLDACLHTTFGALNLNGEDAHRRGNVFLPVRIQQIRLYSQLPSKIISHVSITQSSELRFVSDISIYDDSLNLIAEVVGLTCQALESQDAIAARRRNEWLLQYEWIESPLPGSSPAATGTWLVLVPDLNHKLVNALEAAGISCVLAVPGAEYAKIANDYVVPLDCSVGIRQMLKDLRENNVLLDGVLHAFCLGGPPRGQTNPTEKCFEELGSCSLIYLVQELTSEDILHTAKAEHSDNLGASAPPIVIVTQETQAVSSDLYLRLQFSSVWGLRRVIANEHPNLSIETIDIDDSPESVKVLPFVLPVSEDDEIALRKGIRHVRRLRRYFSNYKPSTIMAASTGEQLRAKLEIGKVGDFNTMNWVEANEVALKDDEIEIEVGAAALNFKDILKATGLFSPRLLEGNLWSKNTLGMECAGRITRIGRSVDNFKLGDNVIALAPGSFGSFAITDRALAVRNFGIPETIGAAIPMAYLTASIGLEHVARLKSGERVLIHAATGGVGLAAIQIAQGIGAEIIASAGSEEKRALLHELGIEHVLDSRAPYFADKIYEMTRGDGVDVVLNSLRGDAISQGLAALKDYGRFIEIGKVDLDRDYSLGLRPFTRCLSFHSVDLDRMLVQERELCGKVLNNVCQRIADGLLQPLPVTTFTADSVGEAYQSMASATHTGKIVIDMKANTYPVNRIEQVSFQSNRSYLLSGGLGGFGSELAAWMAKKGAGRLVLLGRRGAETPGATMLAMRLRELGADVQIERCDVSSIDEVRSVLSTIPPSQPLAGVFHAAAVLDDALIKNMDAERYYRTFEPKATGAWNLHLSTLSQKLDYFMCFSSIASIVGNQGSGNYCAANFFTDSLAHYRRMLGLPALTVNWGVIADVGMAAEEDFYRQNLERNGLYTMHSTHCLDLLETLMVDECTQTAVSPMNWETWLRFNPAGKNGRFRELIATNGKQFEQVSNRSVEETELRAKLEVLDQTERERVAIEVLTTVLSEVLKTSSEKIDSTRSLTALGVDSLMAIEIKNRLDRFGLALSVTQLLNRSSPATLAGRLLEALQYGSSETDTHALPTEKVNSATSPWLQVFMAKDNPKVRLFCFPYAGGGTSVYKEWNKLLPDWIEVVGISMPGRGARTHEQALERITDIADMLSAEISAYLDRPFALFGHCMGAIVMYETALRLQNVHGKVPIRVFASGSMAPHLYNSPVVYEQDDDLFFEVLKLISFSATRALIDDRELRTAIFPMLRSDFKAVAHYGDTFGGIEKLRAPITGLAADKDLFAAPNSMKAWASYTAGECELVQLQGNHYFVESDREKVVELIARCLTDNAGPTLDKALSGVTRTVLGPSSLGCPPLSHAQAVRERRPKPHAGQVKVYCFPGGGILASEMSLPSDTPLIQYEGIDWRDSIEQLRSIEEIVDDVSKTVRCQGRYILYGHCIGALVAYELTLRLREESAVLPELLVFAGIIGPHLYVAPNAHTLPDDKLLEMLDVIHYPFVHQLRSDTEFRLERLPKIRADLEAMAGYEYRQSKPLSLPITAISMRDDLWNYPLRADSWKLHTQDECRILALPGDHYQPNNRTDLVHSEICAFLEEEDGKLGEVTSKLVKSA